MAAAPISAAQAACLRNAGMRTLETAGRLLVAAEQQAFNLEEGLTLLCEATGAVAVAFPKADVVALIPRAVMSADFGLLNPEAAKRKAGLQ